jgi:hypothetical protein
MAVQRESAAMAVEWLAAAMELQRETAVAPKVAR